MDNFTNLEHLKMSDEELFSQIDHDSLESEKITAPRYSYWHSVFRVFFRKKNSHSCSFFYDKLFLSIIHEETEFSRDSNEIYIFFTI